MQTSTATTDPLISLARDLVRRPSVTPEDAGCLEILGDRLRASGFICERLDADGVSNLWARRGIAEPLFVFAGHTDVVPTGDVGAWSRDPFSAEVDDVFLHGRGAADMKGSLAAMVLACEDLLAAGEPNGSIGFLFTSDEEGPATHGTRHVMQVLAERGEQIDLCVVGEPSSGDVLGDVVRVGRRGSLNATLHVHGIQGHVAYPDQARNPIHQALGALKALAETTWDTGNDFFPPTGMQISNMHAGTGATNVIPGSLEVRFNFRFCTERTAEDLQDQVESILRAHGLDFSIDWTLSGNPFLTEPGRLVSAVQDAIRSVSGIDTELSTGGGTSDGRFIAPSGAEVVELGPCNATIHSVDERVPIAHLHQLRAAYGHILRTLLT